MCVEKMKKNKKTTCIGSIIGDLLGIFFTLLWCVTSDAKAVASKDTGILRPQDKSKARL